MDKNKFQPSLLRGLYRTESVPVSWDEVFRLISKDETVKQQTERYRSTREEKYKHAMPALTTAVQLDGKGKAMENIVGYTGVTHCDLDHVPEERLGEVLKKIKADSHTFLCNVSPSGRGVHIYAEFSVEDLNFYANCQKINRELIEKLNIPSEENNFMDNLRIIDGNLCSQIYDMAFMAMNCYYADLLGLPFDEQCSNPNKTLSLSHDPNAYFNPNAETFSLSTDSCSTLLRKRTSSSVADLKDFLSSENNLFHPLNPLTEKPNSLTERKHWTKVEQDPIEAAVEYVERQGYTYTEGCRNAYLMRCLMHLNKLGVPQAEAERWALSHNGLPQREIMGIVRSCYRHTAEHGTYEMPYRWERQNLSSSFQPGTSSTHARENSPAPNEKLEDEMERKEAEERLRRCPQLEYMPFPEYQWPQFIQQMVDCGETKPQRDIILLSAFTVLGAMLGRLVRFKYSKRYWHPALQTFIVAPPASGKSVVSLVRRVAEPLHDELLACYDHAKKAYDKEKAAYDMAGRERANMDIPVPPVMRMFLIAGNNSSTGILENLADAEGHALICESEADTLSAAINADYGNWDDTLRKAHDHDRLSYNRRTNKEYRQIRYPCMGVLICGTPAQVKPLIPSAENGLFSRQLFATLPPIGEFIDQFGDDGIDLNAKFLNWGREWLATLKQLKSEVSSIELRLGEGQKEAFNRKFQTLFKHADATRFDHHMKSSVAREAINILRIMAVAAFFRSRECPGLLVPDEGIPEENVRDGVCPRYILHVTDDDMNAVLSLTEPLYRTACEVLTLLPWTEAERMQPSAMEQLLGSLPLRFTRKEAVERARRMGVSEDTLDTKLRRMRKTGQLRAVETGVYEFCDNR